MSLLIGLVNLRDSLIIMTIALNINNLGLFPTSDSSLRRKVDMPSYAAVIQ